MASVAGPEGSPRPDATASPTVPASGGFIALFVRRQVLAVVASLLIVVAGIAGIAGVEVRELPSVERPVITVSTDYSGAAPETIDREITAVIEAAAGRVPGVGSISSSSSFGRSRVSVDLRAGADLDVAAADMRDAIARVSRDLPDGADDPRIVKADSDAQAILRLAVTSAERSAEELTVIVEERVVERLTAVDGVADVQVYGDRPQVFRVDVDPARLASRGLTVADLAAALSDLVFDTPAGSLASDAQDLSVRATAEIDSAEDFEALRVSERVRLGDVAAVSLGADIGTSALRANGRTGIGLGVVRQAGSNTLDISREVRAVVARLNGTLPDDIDVRVTSDDATFINGAIGEVLKTLTLAILIVIGIIYLFLLNWRATLVPAITLPVALIGTVAGIWLVGFSINILTLLALVLATGLVVDDAIVVLENIVARRDAGLGPRAAAVVGTREVFFAVIATTATLVSVFVPLSFLPGQAGGLFREFGFVLAIAVTISSFVALSLCPMLASRLLRALGDAPRVAGTPAAAVRRVGAAAASLYARALDGALAAPLLIVAASAAFAVSAWLALGTLREELVPPEDRSVVLLSVSAPQGVSLDYTATQLRRIERLVQPLVARGEAENVFSIAGTRGNAASGFMVVTLAPWDERARGQQEIVADINRDLREVPGVRAFAIQPNSLGIRGAGRGLRVALLGDDYAELAVAGRRLVEALEADGRFGRVQLDYETSQPELRLEIDRERAADLGIAIDGLAAAMQAVLDGREIGEVFIDDRAVAVKLVSTAQPIDDPTDLANLYLETGDGRIVPMSSIATLLETAIAPSLPREQRSRAVDVSASLGPDISLRGAMEEAERLAEPLLPDGARLIPLAEAAALDETSSGVALTFVFALVIVFLVLAAQFESFLSSLILIVTVPLGLACAVFALALTGTSLNVYSQIGLVLLVGIMAKNGILVVEFANRLRDAGASPRDAAHGAATRRLRPVAMTLFSTVLGAIPLVLASGAGAEARVALGWVIVGGLGFATVFTLFLTPVAYRLLAGFSAPRGAGRRRLEEELAAADGARSTTQIEPAVR